MAHVDLRAVRRGKPRADCSSQSEHLALALRRIQQTVRSDDRVCPFGVARIAVAFGPDAQAVPARTLGERLARAVGDRSTTGPAPTTAVVTVDRLLRDGILAPERIVRTPGPGALAGPGDVNSPRLRRRTVVRFPTGYGNRHDDPARTPGGSGSGTVLVVDPTGSTSTTPGLTVAAACSLAARLGFRAAMCSATAGDDLPLDVDGTPIDLVVLVISGEPAGGAPAWSTSSWCVPSQITAAYRAAGINVLAVGAGAGAGALAGCVEMGAGVLFDLEELPTALSNLRGNGMTPGPTLVDDSVRRNQSTLDALVQLTTSERRVLFFLTQGRAAGEIADDLVVSLTTVRSHIRSILRKLGVRSQLAAVAVANSLDLRYQGSTGDPRREADRTPGPGSTGDSPSQ